LGFLARGEFHELLETDKSIGERLFTLQEHLQLVVARPWTGYGLGAANRFWLDEAVLLPSHNVFIELAVNFGALYVVFLVFLLFWLLRNRHRPAVEQHVRSNLFAQMVFAIVILGMADNTVFYSRPFISVLGGLVGLLATQHWTTTQGDRGFAHLGTILASRSEDALGEGTDVR